MNSLELRKQVTHLKEVKKQNEENVTPEDLQGRYRESYRKLCENLKASQAELKAMYVEFLRQIVEILSESIYADPDEEYQIMHDRFHGLDNENGGDPLFRRIMAAVFSFEDVEAEQ